MYKKDVSTKQKYACTHQKDASTHEKDVCTHQKDASTHEKDVCTHKNDASALEKDVCMNQEDAQTYLNVLGLPQKLSKAQLSNIELIESTYFLFQDFYRSYRCPHILKEII